MSRLPYWTCQKHHVMVTAGQECPGCNPPKPRKKPKLPEMHRGWIYSIFKGSRLAKKRYEFLSEDTHQLVRFIQSVSEKQAVAEIRGKVK